MSVNLTDWILPSDVTLRKRPAPTVAGLSRAYRFPEPSNATPTGKSTRVALRLGLVACAVFYIGISAVAFNQQWPKVRAWLGG